MCALVTGVQTCALPIYGGFFHAARPPPGSAMIWSRSHGEAAWLRPGEPAWLLLSFRYGEGAGDAPLGAALHRIAVGPARRAAPVDGGASAVQVAHQPPPTQIVAALAPFDIAHHGYPPPVEC